MSLYKKLYEYYLDTSNEEHPIITKKKYNAQEHKDRRYLSPQYMLFEADENPETVKDRERYILINKNTVGTVEKIPGMSISNLHYRLMLDTEDDDMAQKLFADYFKSEAAFLINQAHSLMGFSSMIMRYGEVVSDIKKESSENI